MKRILLILLLFSSVAYGSDEIRAYYPSGFTLYAVIRDGTGQAFDTAGTAFEVWNTMSDYDISLTDKSGGMYIGDFPAADAGSYTIMVHAQQEGSPADSDPPVQFEEGYWDTVVWRSEAVQLQDIFTDTNDTLPTAISNITVDNGAIADEVVTHMDANSTQLAAIVEDTGTTIPNQISGLNNFDPNNDDVAVVALVNTTTTNTDMRGTDGANTTVPDIAGTAAGLHLTTDALINGLNDLSTAQVNAEVDSALSDYNAPTKTEMDSGFAALNDITVTEIWNGIVEGSYTYQDFVRLMGSVMFGKASGGNSTNIKFRDTADTKNRIDETVDAYGNRTSVTLDPD